MTVHHHGPFSFCECCGRMGNCYYGERIALKRAKKLEHVLETIERYYADGQRFTNMDMSLSSGLWWSSVYTILRWLHHLGILERHQAYTNGTVYWSVRSGND